MMPRHHKHVLLMTIAYGYVLLASFHGLQGLGKWGLLKWAAAVQEVLGRVVKRLQSCLPFMIDSLSSAILILDCNEPRVDAGIVSWVERTDCFRLGNAQLIMMYGADKTGPKMSPVLLVRGSCILLTERWFNGRHACTILLHWLLRVKLSCLSCLGVEGLREVLRP